MFLPYENLDIHSESHKRHKQLGTLGLWNVLHISRRCVIFCDFLSRSSHVSAAFVNKRLLVLAPSLLTERVDKQNKAAASSHCSVCRCFQLWALWASLSSSQSISTISLVNPMWFACPVVFELSFNHSVSIITKLQFIFLLLFCQNIIEDIDFSAVITPPTQCRKLSRGLLKNIKWCLQMLKCRFAFSPVTPLLLFLHLVWFILSFCWGPFCEVWFWVSCSSCKHNSWTYTQSLTTERPNTICPSCCSYTVYTH